VEVVPESVAFFRAMETSRVILRDGGVAAVLEMLALGAEYLVCVQVHGGCHFCIVLAGAV
jgi:hypothetical protein